MTRALAHTAQCVCVLVCDHPLPLATPSYNRWHHICLWVSCHGYSLVAQRRSARGRRGWPLWPLPSVLLPFTSNVTHQPLPSHRSYRLLYILPLMWLHKIKECDIVNHLQYMLYKNWSRPFGSSISGSLVMLYGQKWLQAQKGWSVIYLDNLPFSFLRLKVRADKFEWQ